MNLKSILQNKFISLTFSIVPLLFFQTCNLGELTPRYQITLLQLALLNNNLRNSITNVEKPTFSPPVGYYSSETYLNLSSPLQGSSIAFTSDGSTPTPSSTLYTEPIHLWRIAGSNIKAIAFKDGLQSSEVLDIGIYSFPNIRTNQTLCHDGAGTLITPSPSCGQISAQGHDGASLSGIGRSYTGPTAHPIFSTDYTTKDNSTGLIWKTCSQGLSGNNCTVGAILNMSWQDANSGTNGCSSLNNLNSGAGFAGRKDWRLPLVEELETLFDYGSSSPVKIDLTRFPATSGTSRYWTSAQKLGFPSEYFSLDFDSTVNSSNVSTRNEGTLLYVRCIAGLTARKNSFIDQVDGTILSTKTNQYWQKCANGLSGSTCSAGTIQAANWNSAVANCNAITLAGRTWRLPSSEDLQALLEFRNSTAPVINTNFFPGANLDYYWSSTSNASDPSKAWRVKFDNILNVINDNNLKSNSTNHFSRCISN
ncbi:MAG: DUF1566 domain-containing protein [Leptospiraceae bacterium]|nr:DUF1566 domain-containing protein [Leptospiraceae bacterium]